MEEKKFEGKSKIIVAIEDIHCGDCALNIERSVEHLPGFSPQRSVMSFPPQQSIMIPYRVEEDRIKKAITKPGYVVRETLAEKTRLLEENEAILFMASSGITLAFSWILEWTGSWPSYLPECSCDCFSDRRRISCPEECDQGPPHSGSECRYPRLHCSHCGHFRRGLPGSRRCHLHYASGRISGAPHR